MNATELFNKEGKPAQIFYCGKCRIVHRTQREAEACCGPRKCSKCGKECQNGWLVCDPCRAAERDQKERIRFRIAVHIPAESYAGVVYLEGVSGDYGDGFHSSVKELLERLESDSADGDDPPEYAWACNPISFACLDVDDLLQRIEEDGDAYEDFDASDLDGIPELAAAVEKFNEANKGVVSYQPDYSRAVVFSPKHELATNQPK